MPTPCSPRPRGFTLVELAVLLVVITVLAVILYPVFFHHGCGGGRQEQCINNVKQICLGMRMYADDNTETLPGVSSSVSWTTSLPETQKVDDRVFNCPSQQETGTANAPEYGYNAFVAGSKLDDVANPSTCPIIADLRMKGHAPNYTIRNWERDITPRHLNGAIVGFVDGHVAWVKGPEKGGSMLLALMRQGCCDPFQTGGTPVTGFQTHGTVRSNAGMPLLPTRSTVQPGAQGYAFSADILLDDIAAVTSCGITAWDGAAQVWIDPAAQTLNGYTPREDGSVRPASAPLAEPLKAHAWYTLKGVVTSGKLTAILYEKHTVRAILQCRAYTAHGTRPGLVAVGTATGKIHYRNLRVFTW